MKDNILQYSPWKIEQLTFSRSNFVLDFFNVATRIFGDIFLVCEPSIKHIYNLPKLIKCSIAYACPLLIPYKKASNVICCDLFNPFLHNFKENL